MNRDLRFELGSRGKIRTTRRTTRRGQRNRSQATRAVLRVWWRWWCSLQTINCFNDQEYHERDDEKVNHVVDQHAVRNHGQAFQLRVSE